MLGGDGGVIYSFGEYLWSGVQPIGSEEGVYTEYIYYVTNLGMRRHALSNV